MAGELYELVEERLISQAAYDERESAARTAIGALVNAFDRLKATRQSRAYWHCHARALARRLRHIRTLARERDAKHRSRIEELEREVHDWRGRATQSEVALDVLRGVFNRPAATSADIVLEVVAMKDTIQERRNDDIKR